MSAAVVSYRTCYYCTDAIVFVAESACMHGRSFKTERYPMLGIYCQKVVPASREMILLLDLRCWLPCDIARSERKVAMEMAGEVGGLKEALGPHPTCCRDANASVAAIVVRHLHTCEPRYLL